MVEGFSDVIDASSPLKQRSFALVNGRVETGTVRIAEGVSSVDIPTRFVAPYSCVVTPMSHYMDIDGNWQETADAGGGATSQDACSITLMPSGKPGYITLHVSADVSGVREYSYILFGM